MRASLIVSLSQFRKNIQSSKKQLKPGVKFLAVVKADAYGHGAVKMARTAELENVDYFGVAALEEAIELREGGVRTPILVLTEPVNTDSLHRALYYDVSLTVYSSKFLKELAPLSKQYEKPIKLHVKVDSGMNRVGIKEDEVIPFIETIKAEPRFYLEGILTHLAEADNVSSQYTNEQYKRFTNVLDMFRRHNLEIPLVHMANSAAVVNFPHTQCDMVRIGISLYKNVLMFKTRVIQVKDIGRGSAVGYGRGFVADSPMKIAVLSVGYADGYNRLLSNKGEVLIKGQRCPVVGNVCMDMIMVHIPDGMDVSKGDEVVLIGKSGQDEITAEEIAHLTGTIDYEVMCGIGKRVPRVYR